MRSKDSSTTSAAKISPALAYSRWFKYTAGATLLVGAVLAGIGADAHAQTPGTAVAQAQYASQYVSHAFGLIDTDSNGRISRSEAVAFRKVANYFDAADSNRDGTLTLDEFGMALSGGKRK